MTHRYSHNGINKSCVRCGKPEKHPNHGPARKRIPGQWAKWFRRKWRIYG